jgi:hypothetical protein
MNTILSAKKICSPQVESPLARPEWLRISETTRLYPIGRSSLYQLIAENKIKSASIKKRGNMRGRRIIYRPSIDAYLASLLEKEH